MNENQTVFPGSFFTFFTFRRCGDIHTILTILPLCCSLCVFSSLSFLVIMHRRQVYQMVSWVFLFSLFFLSLQYGNLREDRRNWTGAGDGERVFFFFFYDHYIRVLMPQRYLLSSYSFEDERRCMINGNGNGNEACASRVRVCGWSWWRLRWWRKYVRRIYTSWR